MGLFDLFGNKKVPKITNEQLIPVLTKDVLPLLQKDWECGEENFTHIKYANIATPEKGKKSVIYTAEPTLAYFDSNSGYTYGFIFTVVEDNYYDNVYLVLYDSENNNFRALFEFEYGFCEEGELRNPKFNGIQIIDVEDGVQASLNYLKKMSFFNGYKNPPPYVMFAQMALANSLI